MNKSKKNENKTYGIHACHALFKNRPQDIIKVVLTKEKAAHFSDLMRYLAKNKKAYNFESDEEIAKFAKTIHHEGICILAKTKKNESLDTWLSKYKNCSRLLILCLEGIENPHNLGAIIRSAAHFAVDAIFYSAKTDLHLDGAVARVAQGGTEFVTTIRVADWTQLLEFAKNSKIKIFTTSDKAKDNLDFKILEEKVMFILGSEAKGLTPFWSKVPAQAIKIHGTNLVESLNVSVASAILTALYRQKYPTLRH